MLEFITQEVILPHEEVQEKSDGKIPRADLEKYYTPERMIKECASLMERFLPHDKIRTIMDPCAGDGRWYIHFRARFTQAKTFLYDYEPDPVVIPGIPSVQKLDFLTQDCGIRPDVIVTNPPFGKANSLSRAIFNRAVDLYKPEYICLLVPRSFSNRKSSLRKLRLGYTKIQAMDLTKAHFERIDGKRYDGMAVVNLQCCFEIWQKNRAPLGEFKMEFVPGVNGGESKVRAVRSDRYNFTLYRPSVNKVLGAVREGISTASGKEVRRTEEQGVLEHFETMAGYYEIRPRLLTLRTHGTRAGETCKFDPVEDKTSVKQFIFSPDQRILDEISKMKKGGGFQEYLGASGFSNNPSLGSEEIMECIEAWLDEHLPTDEEVGIAVE
jgi:hypothetical protein